MSLPDRFFKRLERELFKAKARQRADKKAAAWWMRGVLSSQLDQTSPADVMEDVKETQIINLLWSSQRSSASLGFSWRSLMPAKLRNTKAERQKILPFSYEHLSSFLSWPFLASMHLPMLQPRVLDSKHFR